MLLLYCTPRKTAVVHEHVHRYRLIVASIEPQAPAQGFHRVLRLEYRVEEGLLGHVNAVDRGVLASVLRPPAVGAETVYLAQPYSRYFIAVCWSNQLLIVLERAHVSEGNIRLCSASRLNWNLQFSHGRVRALHPSEALHFAGSRGRSPEQVPHLGLEFVLLFQREQQTLAGQSAVHVMESLQLRKGSVWAERKEGHLRLEERRLVNRALSWCVARTPGLRLPSTFLLEQIRLTLCRVHLHQLLLCRIRGLWLLAVLTAECGLLGAQPSPAWHARVHRRTSICSVSLDSWVS